MSEELIIYTEYPQVSKIYQEYAKLLFLKLKLCNIKTLCIFEIFTFMATLKYKCVGICKIKVIATY